MKMEENQISFTNMKLININHGSRNVVGVLTWIGGY
jgi:hypothetical protein